MSDKEILDLTDELRNSTEKWEHNLERDRWTAKVDAYTIHCDRRTAHAEFQVEHDRFGIMVPWRVVRSLTVAKGDALDYVRACIHGQREHAEA